LRIRSKNVEIREYTKYNEEEISCLYNAVGWTAYTENMPALREGFKNSMLVLAAYDGEELLGIIRTVGDGATIVFVQDILVFPDKQRRGIGTALLKEILNRYPNVRQIELATDNTAKTVAFYKSMGFAEMSEIGCCGFMKCH
jgi:ribosomal protein S18 acetylase RimI-like enzyme